ncbi:DNA topoisomerase VI subunit B [Acidobacteriota bacterium]
MPDTTSTVHNPQSQEVCVVSNRPSKVSKARPRKKKADKGKDADTQQLDLFESSDSPSQDLGMTKAGKNRKKPVIIVKPKNNHTNNRKRAKPQKENAHTLAARQREISISEFFTKNRHLLGFDNPQKALLTTTKEAVDNALDACEEADILPEIEIKIRQLDEQRFTVEVGDNGPGIVKAQIPKIFGKLLYGSKFHRLKQSRGQQGIGISAAGMYGHLTSGKPVRIISKTDSRSEAHLFEVTVDTRKNTPQVLKDEPAEFEKTSGTTVAIELEAIYRKGKRSVDDYISQTALANPHAHITYKSPKGDEHDYPRLTDDMPGEPTEIKPHPHGLELGMFIRMAKETKSRNIRSFLMQDFSRISPRTSDLILRDAGLAPRMNPKKIGAASIESLYGGLTRAKLMNPPTDCLSPIGEDLLIEALRQRFDADFYTALTRKPVVYRGNPFLVEVGLAYGGDLGSDEVIDIFRLANRVPLLYQQAACAITKSIINTDWKPYGLSQSKQALPVGPMALIVHIASVWVPFTSESKEAIAHYPEIVKEVRLSLMDCGRRLMNYVRKRRHDMAEKKKRMYIEKYIPHIGIALKQILKLSDKKEAEIVSTLTKTLERSRS